MFNFTEDLKIVSSFHTESKPYGKMESRKAHGFVLRITGSARYFFEDKTVDVREGEAIFLPQGSCYEYTTEANGGNMYISINFLAGLDSPEVKVFPLEDFHGAGFITQRFAELWKFGGTADKYTCLSVLCDLLSYVSRLESQDSLGTGKESIIEPAVDYLKRNIYSPSLRVDKLHRICGISDTYFRRIFESRFHMSPREYVVKERITHARAILDGGDYDTVAEVAAAVGYSDPLYFSKEFKRFYGISPSRINK